MYTRLINLGCVLVRTLALWRENDRSNWFPLVTNAIAPELLVTKHPYPISPKFIFLPYTIPHKYAQKEHRNRTCTASVVSQYNISASFICNIFYKGCAFAKTLVFTVCKMPVRQLHYRPFHSRVFSNSTWVFFREKVEDFNDSWHKIWDLSQTLYTNDYTCRKPSVRLQLFILHE